MIAFSTAWPELMALAHPMPNSVIGKSVFRNTRFFVTCMNAIIGNITLAMFLDLL
jgi:hypothetical protein